MQGLDWLKQGVWSVLLCVAVGLFFLGGAEAAVTWEKSYNDKTVIRLATEPAADGGYASLALLGGAGYYIPAVQKLDALGNIEWYRKYPLVVGKWGGGITFTPTNDGGFILCGGTYNPYSPNDALIMKLDSEGNVLWSKSYKLAVPPNYNTGYYQYVRSNYGIRILEADDGGYVFLARDVIARDVVWAKTTINTLWLVKLDVDGGIQWQKTLASSAYNQAADLLKMKDGTYVVTAYASNGSGTTVLKLDAVGAIRWAKTFSSTPISLFVESLTELNDGSVALTGTSNSPWVVKLDAFGNIVWQKTYGSIGNFTSHFMLLPAANNGLLLAGGLYKPTLKPTLLKLDSAGIAEWLADLNGGGNVLSFRPTADGGYVLVANYAIWGGDRFANFFKLDTNAEGCRPYLKSYLTTTIDNNFSVADASVNTVLTDAVPVSIAVVAEDLSPPTSTLYCISALPEIAIDASALDYGFGSVEVFRTASAKVFLSNSCGADLNVSAMTITGANAGDFTLTTDCSAVVAGGSCTAEIVFAPGSLGAKLALLTITSDDPKQPKIEIPLSGQAVDSEAPVITLLGQAELNLEVGSAYVDAGATALDNYDGDLTSAIVISNPINPAVVGNYLVTYDVVDASGNRATQLVRTVHVVDTIAPEVSLSVDHTLLWPPNHKMVDIQVDGDARDSGSGLLSVVLTVNDEYGKYNLTLPAFSSTVALEAWRDGQDKDGRVYTLTAVATDRAGNTTTRSSNILVPHDMGN